MTVAKIIVVFGFIASCVAVLANTLHGRLGEAGMFCGTGLAFLYMLHYSDDRE